MCAEAWHPEPSRETAAEQEVGKGGWTMKSSENRSNLFEAFRRDEPVGKGEASKTY